VNYHDTLPWRDRLRSKGWQFAVCAGFVVTHTKEDVTLNYEVSDRYGKGEYLWWMGSRGVSVQVPRFGKIRGET
jgi:hypothetical protein